MGFISSSRVLNIVMTLFFRKEENSKKTSSTVGKATSDLQQPLILVFISPNAFLPFLPHKASIFCQDKVQYVSAHCCLEMFDRGAQ